MKQAGIKYDISVNGSDLSDFFDKKSYDKTIGKRRFSLGKYGKKTCFITFNRVLSQDALQKHWYLHFLHSLQRSELFSQKVRTVLICLRRHQHSNISIHPKIYTFACGFFYFFPKFYWAIQKSVVHHEFFKRCHYHLTKEGKSCGFIFLRR